MEFVSCEKEGDLALLRMTRGKANALNRAMIEELLQAVAQAAADDGVWGVVLASGIPNFFSSGFDIVEVFQYDRTAMAEFFGRFIDLYESVLRFPKPFVAAVNGHAFAGGAVLAIMCDTRVLAAGDYGLALNEVNLGIVLPPGIIRAVLNVVGIVNARELLLQGSTITPARAMEIRLANEVVAPEALLARALEQASTLAAKPAAAFAAIKQSLVTAADHATPVSDRKFLPQFIEHWFSAEAETHKQTLQKSMRR